MREIKFRGRRVDNGEWVYGDSIECSITGKKYIFPLGSDANESSKVGEEGCLRIVTLEVIPETVGQFTGLHDKNGKEIYEGDIVRCICPEGSFTAVVEFGNPNGLYSWGWQLKPIGSANFNPDILLWVETELDHVTCEVIGNIYENLELLEETP